MWLHEDKNRKSHEYSSRDTLQLYLWQIADVDLHVAALAGPVQPLHVHIQRPGTQREHFTLELQRLNALGGGEIVRHSPVVGDVEVKVADVRRVFGQNDVAGELSRGEPEGKVWHIIELEFSMNSAEGEHKEIYCSAKMCPRFFSPLWQNDRRGLLQPIKCAFLAASSHSVCFTADCFPKWAMNCKINFKLSESQSWGQKILNVRWIKTPTLFAAALTHKDNVSLTKVDSVDRINLCMEILNPNQWLPAREDITIKIHSLF